MGAIASPHVQSSTFHHLIHLPFKAKMANDGSSLCEYCSQIDFDLLDHPSQADFRDLLAQQAVPRRSLQRYAPGRSFSDWGWSLGLQSRIAEQAKTCSLCHAVSEILQQNSYVRESWKADDEPVCIAKIAQCGQVEALEKGSGSVRDGAVLELKGISLYWQLRDEKNGGPGVVEDFEGEGLKGMKLEECLRACIPGTLDCPQSTGVFLRDVERNQELALAGDEYRASLIRDSLKSG